MSSFRRLLFAPAFIAVSLALIFATPAEADFKWVDPTWTLAFMNPTLGPSAVANPSFGSNTADIANAGGTISANSDPNTANSGGFVTVTFSRQFELFDDPDDEADVTLFGALSGTLDTTSAAPKIAVATDATGQATIENVADRISFNSISATDSAIAIDETDNVAVFMLKEDSMTLDDAVYTLSGELTINLRANQGPTAIAAANADINWLVGLTVTPEPASYLELGAEIGLVAVWLYWGKKRRLAPHRLRQ